MKSLTVGANDQWNLLNIVSVRDNAGRETYSMRCPGQPARAPYRRPARARRCPPDTHSGRALDSLYVIREVLQHSPGQRSYEGAGIRRACRAKRRNQQ